MPIYTWAPTTDDVGARLRARTKDRSGNELGTFTDETRPTGRQVALIIDQVSRDLADLIKDPVPERLWPSARVVATLDAALQVELSYFPEQVGTGRSPYPQLKELRDERMAQFRADLRAEGGVVAGEGSVPPDPSFHFPTRRIIGFEAGPW